MKYGEANVDFSLLLSELSVFGYCKFVNHLSSIHQCELVRKHQKTFLIENAEKRILHSVFQFPLAEGFK